MKKAILYIRVSTDEQAERGYSLKYQEERLRQYCEIHDIEIISLYREDHSAKTFNRPEFKKLLSRYNRNKEKANYLLFTKWDRFSRNTTEAYAMIQVFKIKRIEPQAIEQPLDLSIPENKMMLAFHLTIPEVENDRRSLNVTVGMRRAKKEGRWMGTAPRGYKNIVNPDGSKSIIFSDEAPLVRWAFEQVATGKYSVEGLRRICNSKGLSIARNSFYSMLRNLAYCGRIFIPTYKDEEAAFVNSLHEPLVPESLFNQVQLIVNKKKVLKTGYETLRPEFPLRNFLNCSRCGKKLTASASTGKCKVKYYYYHCQKGCHERLKAYETNLCFSKRLSTIVFNVSFVDLFRVIFHQVFQLKTTGKNINVSDLRWKIGKNKERIQEAQRLMLDKQLNAAEYQEIKLNYESNNEKLKRELGETDNPGDPIVKSTRLAIKYFSQLEKLYVQATLEDKRQIIRLLFSENMVIKAGKFCSFKLRDVVLLISGANKDKTNYDTSNNEAYIEYKTIGIEQCRKILANIVHSYRDEEIIAIRNFLYQISDIVWNNLQNDSLKSSALFN